MSTWANGRPAVPKTVYAGSIPAVDTYAFVAQLVEQLTSQINKIKICVYSSIGRVADS